MKTRIAILSTPPELEVEEKFFNKACCYLPDLGICDFIHLPEKGLSAMSCYEAEIQFTSNGKKISVRVESIDSKSVQPVQIKVGK